MLRVRSIKGLGGLRADSSSPPSNEEKAKTAAIVCFSQAWSEEGMDYADMAVCAAKQAAIHGAGAACAAGVNYAGQAWASKAAYGFCAMLASEFLDWAAGALDWIGGWLSEKSPYIASWNGVELVNYLSLESAKIRAQELGKVWRNEADLILPGETYIKKRPYDNRADVDAIVPNVVWIMRGGTLSEVRKVSPYAIRGDNDDYELILSRDRNGTLVDRTGKKSGSGFSIRPGLGIWDADRATVPSEYDLYDRYQGISAGAIIGAAAGDGSPMVNLAEALGAAAKSGGKSAADKFRERVLGAKDEQDATRTSSDTTPSDTTPSEESSVAAAAKTTAVVGGAAALLYLLLG